MMTATTKLLISLQILGPLEVGRQRGWPDRTIFAFFAKSKLEFRFGRRLGGAT